MWRDGRTGARQIQHPACHGYREGECQLAPLLLQATLEGSRLHGSLPGCEFPKRGTVTDDEWTGAGSVRTGPDSARGMLNCGCRAVEAQELHAPLGLSPRENPRRRVRSACFSATEGNSTIRSRHRGFYPLIRRGGGSKWWWKVVPWKARRGCLSTLSGTLRRGRKPRGSRASSGGTV